MSSGNMASSGVEKGRNNSKKGKKHFKVNTKDSILHLTKKEKKIRQKKLFFFILLLLLLLRREEGGRRQRGRRFSWCRFHCVR